MGILTFSYHVGARLSKNHYDWELAFRKALFQVSTVHTSCGFATDDYNMWPPFTWLLLFIAMLSGGCTGSTSGGIKNMRLLIVARAIRNEFKHLLHPNAVLPVRINKQTVSSSIVTTVLIFFCFLSGSDPDWVDGSFVFGSWLFRVRQYGYFEYRQ